MKIAIVGGGWAGLSAAVTACQAGHEVTVFEAASTLGGRARALPFDTPLPHGATTRLDNGQHILIGAYTQTLDLMRELGVDDEQVLLRRPLAMSFADGSGLQTPDWASTWPAPLDALAAIILAKGWRWGDKLSLLRTCMAWQLAGFQCGPTTSVTELCRGLSPILMTELIEPLCVSALNTPAQEASGLVFLRVLKDALFGVRGGSHLLLPIADLDALLPQAAARWLRAHGAQVRTGTRIQHMHWQAPHWWVHQEPYEQVIWATGTHEAHRAMARFANTASADGGTEQTLLAQALKEWAACTGQLQFKAIATLYAWAPDARLPQPMLALRSGPAAPAQFVFDRGQLGGPAGLLAFVVSASEGGRDALQG
ncbi:MAG: hypothetical protein RL459_1150, partial [Pseudomonadota bacterium]